MGSRVRAGNNIHNDGCPLNAKHRIVIVLVVPPSSLVGTLEAS